jgi:hypothetical protein
MQDALNSCAWQGLRDSNPRPSVLETDALPAELNPYAHLTLGLAPMGLEGRVCLKGGFLARGAMRDMLFQVRML